MKKFTNDYFNDIFKLIGYTTWEYPNDKDKYILFVKGSPMGVEYFGSFIPVFKKVDGKKTVIGFSAYYPLTGESEGCYSCIELVDVIKKYNETVLPAPAYCFNPLNKKSYNFSLAFDWYTKKLGMTVAPNSDSSMIIKDMYKGEIVKISLYFNDNDDTGDVYRVISSSSWSTVKFKTMEEMFGAVNSLLEPELLFNTANALNALNYMTKERGNIEDTRLNSDFTKYVSDAKERIKTALKDALARLENE